MYAMQILGFSKKTHKQILGQVMDFNNLKWIFYLVLAQQRFFDQES
jgi:hypothetical protein